MIVASLVLALALPAQYEAVATVTVEPPVIPDKLAPNTIAADTETRFENLKLQLLARDSLSSIIDRREALRGRDHRARGAGRGGAREDLDRATAACDHRPAQARSS